MGRVLTGNGITRYGDGRDALLQLCRQRLGGFREQRGEKVFAPRSRHRSPISGSVKVRVLTRARGCWKSRAPMLLIRNGGIPRRCLQPSRRRDVSRSGP